MPTVEQVLEFLGRLLLSCFAVGLSVFTIGGGAELVGYEVFPEVLMYLWHFSKLAAKVIFVLILLCTIRFFFKANDIPRVTGVAFSAAAYCFVLSCSSLYLSEGFSNKLKLHFAITSLAKVFGYGVFVFLVVGLISRIWEASPPISNDEGPKENLSTDSLSFRFQMPDDLFFSLLDLLLKLGLTCLVLSISSIAGAFFSQLDVLKYLAVGSVFGLGIFVLTGSLLVLWAQPTASPVDSG